MVNDKQKKSMSEDIAEIDENVEIQPSESGDQSAMSIKLKAVLLLSILAAIVIGSNLYIQILVGGAQNAIEQQSEALNHQSTVISATKAFDDMRYWYADLAITLSDQSEKQAMQARQRLEEELDKINKFEPQAVELILPDVEAVTVNATAALDSYIF